MKEHIFIILCIHIALLLSPASSQTNAPVPPKIRPVPPTKIRPVIPSADAGTGDRDVNIPPGMWGPEIIIDPAGFSAKAVELLEACKPKPRPREYRAPYSFPSGEEFYLPEYREAWEELLMARVDRNQGRLYGIPDDRILGALWNVGSPETIPTAVKVFDISLERDDQYMQFEMVQLLFLIGLNTGSAEALDEMFRLLDLADAKYGDNPPYKMSEGVTIREELWQKLLRPNWKDLSDTKLELSLSGTGVQSPGQKLNSRMRNGRQKLQESLSAHQNPALSDNNRRFIATALNLKWLTGETGIQSDIPLHPDVQDILYQVIKIYEWYRGSDGALQRFLQDFREQRDYQDNLKYTLSELLLEVAAVYGNLERIYYDTSRDKVKMVILADLIRNLTPAGVVAAVAPAYEKTRDPELRENLRMVLDMTAMKVVPEFRTIPRVRPLEPKKNYVSLYPENQVPDLEAFKQYIQDNPETDHTKLQEYIDERSRNAPVINWPEGALKNKTEE